MVTEKKFENPSASAKYSEIELCRSSNPTPPWEYRSAKRSPEQPQAGNSVASSKNNIENVVYITKSGKKYHSQNCPTIKNLARSLLEAKQLQKVMKPVKSVNHKKRGA